MLGTAQADAFSTQFAGFLRILRCVRIGPDLQPAIFVRPAHDPSEVTGNGCVYGCDHSVVDITGGAVQGDEIPFLEDFAAQFELLVGFVHLDGTAAGYAAFAHASGYYRSVGSHTASDGQNAFRSLHAADVFRGSFQTD